MIITIVFSLLEKYCYQYTCGLASLPYDHSFGVQGIHPIPKSNCFENLKGQTILQDVEHKCRT
jgi:hypothetical protein